MKRFMISAVIAAVSAMATFSTPATAADVGVTISVGQPGFYGVIHLGDYPRRPRLIYDQPVIVDHIPHHHQRPPLYLRVPPAHIRNWQYYCRRYNACGERVYFVMDDWYNREYVPYYRKKHRKYYYKHFEKHNHRPYHWSYDEDPYGGQRDRRDYDDRKYREDDRDRRDWDKDRDRRDDRRD